MQNWSTVVSIITWDACGRTISVGQTFDRVRQTSKVPTACLWGAPFSDKVGKKTFFCVFYLNVKHGTSFRNAYNFIFIFRAQNRYSYLACGAHVFLEVFLHSLGTSSCKSVEADVNPTSTPIVISASCRMNSNSFWIANNNNCCPHREFSSTQQNDQNVLCKQKTKIQVKMWKM